MRKPSKGDIIVFTSLHPYYHKNAGDRFGIVIKVDCGIVVVAKDNGETDRVL